MDIVDLNIILYYADFLSLKNSSTTVTDNCKYYFVHKTPVNLAYLHNSEPFYDAENKYYIQAHQEYQLLLDNFGKEGVQDFATNLCNLAVMGCIDAELMLKQIHQFSTKIERKLAFKDYIKWINTQHYWHTITNDDGESIREECTRYIAHLEKENSGVYYERDNKSTGILKSGKTNNNS